MFDSNPPTAAPFRPWLPWLALGVVLGATTPTALQVATGLTWSPWTWWFVVACPLAASAIAICSRYGLAARWLCFAVAACTGMVLGDGWQKPPTHEEPRLLAVSGVVSAVKWSGVTQGIAIVPDASLQPTDFIPPKRLFVRTSEAFGLAAGDQVQVAGRWRRGERGDELQATYFQIIQPRETGPRGWAWRAVDDLGAHRSLAGALLLGVGDPPEKAAFRASGLLHILAVSGAHLAIAAGLGAWLLRLCGFGWTARALALGALICGYTWLTSAAPATQRALAMSLAIIACGLLAREPHRLTAVSLAALVLVLIDPSNATDLGFQLSLAAVLGIVTIGVDVVKLRQRWLPLQPWPLDRPTWRLVLASSRIACDGFAIGAAACLAITPLIAWTFATANPWSPLTTLLATPPTTVALWTGLPYLVLDGIWPEGPWQGMAVIIDGSLAVLVQVVEWSASLLGAQLACGHPHAIVLLCWPFLFLRIRDGVDLGLRIIAIIMTLTMW